jgi:WD40 repeat protein/formylglycine-generating enzyme required for sulfatase activity
MPDQPKPPPCPATPTRADTQAEESLDQSTDLDLAGRAPVVPVPVSPPTAARFPFLAPPGRPGDLGRLGPYRVTRLLGEGGMGFVFRAEDDALQRPIALKVMRPEIVAKPHAAQRFLREGRAAAQVKSDHVTVIYQVGEAGGVPYLAMEYLAGSTLEDWLAARPGPPPASALLKIARDTLRGLSAAHEKGLVHRDVKPSNLWVEAPTGRVKVLDFGLTRGAGKDQQLTHEGAVVGTPSYMAPEQAAVRPVDARADLFSVGCVLYRALTGRSPFQRESVLATLTALAVDIPAPASAVAPTLPHDLAGLIDRLMSKDPSGRPESAKATLAEVVRIEKRLRGQSAVAPAAESLPVVYAPAATIVADENPWAGIDDEAAPATVTAPEAPAAVLEPELKSDPTPTAAPPWKRLRELVWVGGWLLGLATVIVGGVIVIKITTKDESETEIKVPEGATVEVKRDGRTVVKVGPKDTAPAKKETVPVAAAGEKIDFAMERKAAEKLLGLKKGHILLRNPLGEELGRITGPDSQLPDGDLYVAEAYFAGTDLTGPELALLACCRRLEVLSCPGNARLTEADYTPVLGLKALRILWLDGPVGEDVAGLIGANGGLEELELSGAICPTPDVLLRTARCPRLRILGCPRGSTEAALAGVVANNPELRCVKVSSSPELRLSTLAPLARLREVECHARQLTPEGVSALVGRPYLDTLIIQGAGEAATRAIAPLAGKLRSLTLLTNGGLEPLDAADVASFQTFLELESLVIRGNHRIDADVLRHLAGAPRLRRLVLDTGETTNRAYTTVDVAEFRRRRPDVALTITVGGKEQVYPRLDAWPGKGEGDGGISAWNLPKVAPPPAVVPFTADQARVHQKEWAAYIKQPVELENGLGMTFRLIPPGEFDFTFGSESGAEPVPDSPLAKIRLTQPYYLGVTKVTVGQFRKFVAETGLVTHAERFGGRGPASAWQPDPKLTWKTPDGKAPAEDDYTVVQITPTEARQFCEWLSRKEEGVVYRLPTEAEWRFAQRGGSALRYILADDPNAPRISALRAGEPGPKPADRGEPNGFGLREMRLLSGTPAEWPADFLRPAGIESPVNPVGEFPPAEPWLGWARSRPGAEPYQTVSFRVLRQTSTARPAVPGWESEQPVLVGKGRPLAPQTAVSRPARIPGVRSWSVELAGHISGASSVSWSPRGDRIASAGGDTSVRLWDRSGNLKAVLLGHSGPVTGVSFSPGGSLLASCDMLLGGDGGGSLRLWDTATGRCRLALPLQWWAQGVAFSPSGKEVAVWGNYESSRIVTLESGATRTLRVVGVCQSVCWSPDGLTLAVLAGDKLTVFDSATAKPLGELTAPDGGPNQTFGGDALYSPNGKWIATGANGKLRLWDAKTRAHLRTLDVPGNASFFAFCHKDGRLLAVATDGQPVRVIDSTDGRVVATLEYGAGYSLAWSPDGTELFAVVHGRPTVYDDTTGKVKRQHDRGRFEGWLTRVSPDGRKLIWKGNGAPTRREFDADSGELLEEPKAPKGYLVASAPDGRWHAYAPDGEGNEYQIVHTDGTSVPLDRTGNFLEWAADPAGTRIAVFLERQVIVWDARTGKRAFALDHPANVAAYRWSPDGKRIATVSADNVVRLWDTATGKPVAFNLFPLPNGGTGSQGGLARAPDGRGLWVSHGTHAALLDTETGRWSPPESFSSGNGIGALALAADGDRLLGRENYNWTILRDRDGSHRILGQYLPSYPVWHPDARRFLGESAFGVRGFDTRRDHRLGTLFPWVTGDHWLCIGPDGHWRGSPGVEGQIVYVAMLEDGSQRTYSPAEFAKAFGWKNDPAKARLLTLDE